MKKKLLLPLALCLCGLALCGKANGQTHLKANALYWAAGITNLSAETALGNYLTLNGEVVYSPWKSVKGNRMQIFTVSPELRYYPWGKFNKLYVGAYIGYHDFKMTKWNYLNLDKYQDGIGWAAGLTVGFQTPISERWSLDVYVGAGFQDSGYKGYFISSGEQYVGWNYSGEWIPYKVGVAFGYRLGKKK